MIRQPDIEAAYERISAHIRHTPTIELEAGAISTDHAVQLKLEHLQHTGSFKVRGAFNTMMSQETGDAGVVAFSGGNHGAAVAYAATKLGVPATIFVPDFAGTTKIERMRGFGAEVIVAGNDVNAIMEMYSDFSRKTGALPVHPYDDPVVLSGQGTVGLEIEKQLPDLDTLIVSVGGGGLIGGIAAWFEDRVKIVAVESEGTATLATAMTGDLTTVIQAEGIAASALGAPTLGALAYDIVTKWPVTSVLVSDAAITEAQSLLWDRARLIGEPGAATALAALTSGTYQPATGERVGVLICGANAQPNWFLG